MKKTFQAFSWGYHGWGNYTKQLVELADAVEAARGFAPPLFVDVRIRRMVRAPGFREKAFEKLLGERYRWMPKLGNRRILEGGGGVKIDAPEAADELLDVVLEAEQQNRRVIFFCSCQRRVDCHRTEVSDLLLAYAKKRKAALTVQEWPGGLPSQTPVEMDAATMKKLVEARDSDLEKSFNLPLPRNLALAVAGGLAHGSVLRCSRGREEAILVTGPVMPSTKGWRLPVSVVYATEYFDGGTLKKDIERDIDERELGPHGVIPKSKRWAVRTS